MSIDTSAAFIGAVPSGRGLRLAVKDVIDMRGRVTTAGCKAVEQAAGPAERDATCLAGAREAERAGELHFVGRTNLDGLAGGATGIKPWSGTPVNPLGPHRIPGGSSRRSAVAVATGHADIAIGTDTGGSVCIPAACTGIAALKTTHGRVPVQGTHALSQTLDSIGPLATAVSGLDRGMQLLEPGFYPSTPAISGALSGGYISAACCLNGSDPSKMHCWPQSWSSVAICWPMNRRPSMPSSSLGARPCNHWSTDTRCCA